jgi:hypothetical protein
MHRLTSYHPVAEKISRQKLAKIMRRTSRTTVLGQISLYMLVTRLAPATTHALRSVRGHVTHFFRNRKLPANGF